MQDKKNHDDIPASLSAKIDVLVQRAKRTAARICTNRGLPATYADAIAADVKDMLHARYDGLHPTTEQMRRITADVPRVRWDRTENAPLCLLAGYYEQITQILDGTAPPPLWDDFLASVVVLEVVKRDTSEEPILICDEEALQAATRRLFYTYAVLINAERGEATEEELRAIQPQDVEVEDDKRDKLIRDGLAMARQWQRLHAQDMEQRQQQKKPRGRPKKNTDTPQATDTTDKQLPATLGDTERTIRQYQNIAYAFGSGVQTADIVQYGQAAGMRPLWQGIEEQRARAASLINDTRADEEDRRRAAELITTTYAAMQVLDGMQVVTQTCAPVSASTDWLVYDFTPHEYTRIITGQPNPNNEQILSCLRGTAWLTTQRAQVVEVAEKLVTERDSSGVILRGEDGKPKRRKVQKKIVTNFQPVGVTFRNEYENDVLIKDATRIRLSVNPLFEGGRSTADKTADGYITAQAQCLKLRQFYDFVTEEERIFRNLVLSRGHIEEDALLSSVFGYDKRQAEANRRAVEAEAAAQEMERNTTATDVQKQEARAAADAAKKNARYCNTIHMGRDVERLKAMFKKAYDNGLLKWYTRGYSTTHNASKQYGRGYVWKWGRTEEESKPTARRGRPRKNG